jgi:hypothetical protein
MSMVLFCHGYANDAIMNGIKKLEKLIYTNLFTLPDLQDRGYLDQSDFSLICSYFFVAGNHNKTENVVKNTIIIRQRIAGN